MMTKGELHALVCGNIKRYRTACGLSQAELAEKIEISHEYVRQLESDKGQKDFTFYTLYKIAAALGRPLDDFMKPL